MKLTNKLGLPESFYEAALNDPYSKGDADYSVTELLKPPRQHALQWVHQSELEEDVSTRFHSLLGQGVHAVLERANKTGVAERRLRAVVKGKVISGGMDLYHDGGTYTDYKVLSVDKIIYGSFSEYETQLNFYAHLLRENKHEINKLQLAAVLRDWKSSKAKDPKYPQAPILLVPIELWPSEKARYFLELHVMRHEKAKDSLPLCTRGERWANARNEWLRCDEWCNVSKFCSQYQEKLIISKE